MRDRRWPGGESHKQGTQGPVLRGEDPWAPTSAAPCHPDTRALQVISGHGAFWKLPFPRAEQRGQWPSPAHVSKAPSGRQAALGPTPSRRLLPPGCGRLRPLSSLGRWGRPRVTCSRRASPRPAAPLSCPHCARGGPTRQPVDGSLASTTEGSGRDSLCPFHHSRSEAFINLVGLLN